jgi:ketosteroid isomerase-like protein
LHPGGRGPGPDDGPVEIRRANVYRVRGDEICEISIFEDDQATAEALFAR